MAFRRMSFVHRQGLLREGWVTEYCPARPAPNLREAVPHQRRRDRADSIPAGTRLGADHGTLSRVQAEPRASSERFVSTGEHSRCGVDFLSWGHLWRDRIQNWQRRFVGWRSKRPSRRARLRNYICESSDQKERLKLLPESIAIEQVHRYLAKHRRFTQNPRKRRTDGARLCN
jgi:hypothetical protein